MKQVTKVYDVYDFDELSQDAKDYAIGEQMKFLIEGYEYEMLSPVMKKAVDEAERMRTPWFVGRYIWEYCKDGILEECRSFDYLKDGRIFSE